MSGMLKQIEQRLEAKKMEAQANGEKDEGKTMGLKIPPAMEADIEAVMLHHGFKSKKAVVRRALTIGLGALLQR